MLGPILPFARGHFFVLPIPWVAASRPLEALRRLAVLLMMGAFPARKEDQRASELLPILVHRYQSVLVDLLRVERVQQVLVRELEQELPE